MLLRPSWQRLQLTWLDRRQLRNRLVTGKGTLLECTACNEINCLVTGILSSFPLRLQLIKKSEKMIWCYLPIVWQDCCASASVRRTFDKKQRGFHALVSTPPVFPPLSACSLPLLVMTGESGGQAREYKLC
jgi:hypothetical protein